MRNENDVFVGWIDKKNIIKVNLCCYVCYM